MFFVMAAFASNGSLSPVAVGRLLVCVDMCCVGAVSQSVTVFVRHPGCRDHYIDEQGHEREPA